MIGPCNGSPGALILFPWGNLNQMFINKLHCVLFSPKNLWYSWKSSFTNVSSCPKRSLTTYTSPHKRTFIMIKFGQWNKVKKTRLKEDQNNDNKVSISNLHTCFIPPAYSKGYTDKQVLCSAKYEKHFFVWRRLGKTSNFLTNFTK